MRWGTAENERARKYVLEHGIEQFINIFTTYKDVTGSPFLWGDELEHQLTVVDPKDGSVRLSLNAADVLEKLTHLTDHEGVDWRPEYGSFMVESVPREPFDLTTASMCSVEGNQKKRYELLDKHGGPNVIATTLVTFPLMGVGKFSTAKTQDSPHSQSIFVPDECINATHPRFANLTANIRLRRQRKVCIQVPLFIDANTEARSVDKKLNIDANPANGKIDCAANNGEQKKMTGFGDEDDEGESTASVVPTVAAAPAGAEDDALLHLYSPATDYYYAQYESNDHQQERVMQRYQACPCPVPSVAHPCIYMDCMAFGMGASCLQITMQLADQHEARVLYDQLAIACGPFLALSSATPFQKGLLADSDVRWLTIAASVDDRQRDEVPRILKSRYDSISVFIGSENEADLAPFNNTHVETNRAAFDRLRAANVDPVLSKHVAHLFIRDPLVMYDQMIEIDDHVRNEHFENIQSTNWQNVRFKPPPLDNPLHIGWRVEFRVMDIMPTPFENSAYSVFVILLARALLKYKARLYIPMTEQDRNIGKAHRRDPCKEKYCWRKDIFAENITAAPGEFVYLNVNEIYNGGQGFVGLVPLVLRFIEEEAGGSLNVQQIREYIALISMRAAGEIPTTAQYWRRFITSQPSYAHDSRINETIAKDIVKRSHDLSFGLVDESYVPRSTIAERAKTSSYNNSTTNKRPREE